MKRCWFQLFHQSFMYLPDRFPIDLLIFPVYLYIFHDKRKRCEIEKNEKAINECYANSWFINSASDVIAESTLFVRNKIPRDKGNVFFILTINQVLESYKLRRYCFFFHIHLSIYTIIMLFTISTLYWHGVHVFLFMINFDCMA